ncbi:hypothetical protein BB561_002010 [Smittium simulii]|uniref:Uncharacterized protein n=1 Tax=Smittium simulii TaxID=133385 RepID=A0A2T9YS16_9FUNG|nr:hypothetical protein BB561_002010 [Smittium simulii]
MMKHNKDNTSSSWSSIHSHISLRTENTSNWSELIPNSEIFFKSPEIEKLARRNHLSNKNTSSPSSFKTPQKSQSFLKSIERADQLFETNKSVSDESFVDSQQDYQKSHFYKSPSKKNCAQRTGLDSTQADYAPNIRNAKNFANTKHSQLLENEAIIWGKPSNTNLIFQENPALNQKTTKKYNKLNTADLSSNHSYDRLSSVISCSLAQNNVQEDYDLRLSQPNFEKDDMITRWLKRGVLGDSRSKHSIRTINESLNSSKINKKECQVKVGIGNQIDNSKKDSSINKNILMSNRHEDDPLGSDCSIDNKPILQNSKNLDPENHNTALLTKEFIVGTNDTNPNFAITETQGFSNTQNSLKLPKSITTTDGVASLFLKSTGWMSSDIISYNEMWKKNLNPESAASGSIEPFLAEYNDYDAISFNQLL